MSDIPPEIINDILSRLPVKSLLRFRCVSKSWCSLIDGEDFIKLHLHRSSKTITNRALLVDSSSTQLFDVDSGRFERLNVGSNGFGSDRVVGCCNGLVLVAPHFDDVVLWNPATRKVNKLPPTPLECSNSYMVHFAIGYDSKNDDYKVVRVLQGGDWVNGASLCLGVKIYSLQTNSWRRIQNFPYLLSDDRKWGFNLNDALHTVVKRSPNSKQVLMAFDLGNEDHYSVPLPEFGKLVCGLAYLGVMGGCLTAFVPGRRNHSELWLMKEYRVKDSWIKIMRFEHPIPDPRNNLSPLAFSKGRDGINLSPLAFSKSGDEVLVIYDRSFLTWYDLRRKSVPLTMHCISGGATSLRPPFHAEIYVGSLVSPYSPGGAATLKQKGGQGKKGKEIKKKRDDFLSVGFKLKL